MIGPQVTIKLSCVTCEACETESYNVQGDSGSDVYCAHPSFPIEDRRRHIADTNFKTPEWCPVLVKNAEALEAMAIFIQSDWPNA